LINIDVLISFSVLKVHLGRLCCIFFVVEAPLKLVADSIYYGGIIDEVIINLRHSMLFHNREGLGGPLDL